MAKTFLMVRAALAIESAQRRIHQSDDDTSGLQFAFQKMYHASLSARLQNARRSLRVGRLALASGWQAEAMNRGWLVWTKQVCLLRTESIRRVADLAVRKAQLELALRTASIERGALLRMAEKISMYRRFAR